MMLSSDYIMYKLQLYFLANSRDLMQRNNKKKSQVFSGYCLIKEAKPQMLSR